MNSNDNQNDNSEPKNDENDEKFGEPWTLDKSIKTRLEILLFFGDLVEFFAPYVANPRKARELKELGQVRFNMAKLNDAQRAVIEEGWIIFHGKFVPKMHEVTMENNCEVWKFWHVLQDKFGNFL